MQKSIRRFCAAVIAAALSLTLSYAQSETNAVPCAQTLSAQSVLTIKNLPTRKAVQQFAFSRENGKSYVYTTQRLVDSVYLARSEISGNTAQCMDYCLLSGYGHGESLEVAEHGGKTYIYIGSKAATSAGSSYWATEITRLMYDAGKVSDEKTLTDLFCATPQGLPVFDGATSYRQNFALDAEKDRIVLLLGCDRAGTGKDILYSASVYRLSAIDEALDNAESPVSLKDMSGALVAYSGTKERKFFCPSGSFQGMEAVGEDSFCVLEGTTSVQPDLVWFSYGANKENDWRQTAFQAVANVHSTALGDFSYTASDGKYTETECIKHENGQYYCSFNPGNGKSKDQTEIYLLTAAQ